MSNKILIIAAHPDDEILGCGGTIAKHSSLGDFVKILIVAEGATSRQKSRDRSQIKEGLCQLKNSAKKASFIVGAKNIEFLDLPDNRLDSLDRLDLIKLIEEKINSFQPKIIYTHHIGDLNIDHRRIHEAVITACRPTPQNNISKIFSFEVASSTEWQPPSSGKCFEPNWFVDISNFFETKMKALSVYESEMREWPHSRSLKAIDSLSRWRGAQIGVEAAEAFTVIRSID